MKVSLWSVSLFVFVLSPFHANGETYPANGETPIPIRRRICATQPIPPGWVVVAYEQSENCVDSEGKKSGGALTGLIIESISVQPTLPVQPAPTPGPWSYTLLSRTDSVIQLLRSNSTGLQICELRIKTKEGVLTCGGYLSSQGTLPLPRPTP